MLLGEGANTEKARNQGATPLFMACQQGHDEVVRMLLGEGANEEKADNSGWTPLFIACTTGHTAVVKLLLDEGANITVEVTIRGHGYTPLFVACLEGHDATVRLMLQYGAESIDEDGAMFKPTANAVLRQWPALSPAKPRQARDCSPLRLEFCRSPSRVDGATPPPVPSRVPAAAGSVCTRLGRAAGGLEPEARRSDASGGGGAARAHALRGRGHRSRSGAGARSSRRGRRPGPVLQTGARVAPPSGTGGSCGTGGLQQLHPSVGTPKVHRPMRRGPLAVNPRP